MSPDLRRSPPVRASIGLALAVLLYVVSQANYPLFHSIVDMVTVFIAGSVFLVVWNGRRHLDNHYYLFIAIAFLAFALLDFMHIIGNKGMGVFPAEYGNLGPTFYITGRYVLGVSFLLAPLFIKRKVSTVPVFAVYLLAVALVLLSVLRWRNFPATYIEGTGLTAFKVYSDYAVCLMLLAGLGLLLSNRRAFDARVLNIIAFALVLSIASGLAFTLYADPFGITNAVGHFFQIASFYFIYLGVVETVLTQPQNILYRSLQQSSENVLKLNSELEDVNRSLSSDIIARKQAEEALRDLNASLEQRVAERTAEVQRQSDHLRALAAELIQAEQKERKRLAKVLHDHIQQLLVAARMQMGLMQRQGLPERFHAVKLGVDAILQEALDASRSLAVELSPPILHQAGLIAALNWLSSRLQEKNQFMVRLRADNKAEPATEDVRLLLFEAARELLLNAMKHSGVSEADVTLARTDGYVKMIVSDAGKGFDADLLRKRSAGETSFGLFSIQQRLTHIGGRMDMATAPGRGTTITLTVPAGEPMPQLPAGSEAWEESCAGRVVIREKAAARRVLIVDDHWIMREGLAGLMQFEPDIEVVGQAANGTEAIELARSLQPDAIVMDIDLGDMSGVEATRRIHAHDPDIKIIGLSVHADKNVVAALLDVGAVACLTKGGRSEDLLAAIRAQVPDGRSHTTEPERPVAGAASRHVDAQRMTGTDRATIRVLVADDHENLRNMLVEQLRRAAGIDVVGEAKDGEDAVRLAHMLRPDVVVMDLSMPRMGGVEATRRLRSELPEMKVIALSAYGETESQVIAMRGAGAADCLLKESACEKLIAAIRACRAGG